MDDGNNFLLTNNYRDDFLIYQSMNQVIIANSDDNFQKPVERINIKTKIKLLNLLAPSNILIFVNFETPKEINIFDIEKKVIKGQIKFPSEITDIKLFSKLYKILNIACLSASTLPNLIL